MFHHTGSGQAQTDFSSEKPPLRPLTSTTEAVGLVDVLEEAEMVQKPYICRLNLRGWSRFLQCDLPPSDHQGHWFGNE